jgi:beta-phosphoglucomutase-like phosphatase (HAD superfamily)
VDGGRYVGLGTMAERRGAFDSFVRSKAEKERKEKVGKRKAAIAGFRELLAELKEAKELEGTSTMASVAASKGTPVLHSSCALSFQPR